MGKGGLNLNPENGAFNTGDGGRVVGGERVQGEEGEEVWMFNGVRSANNTFERKRKKLSWAGRERADRKSTRLNSSH